MKMKSLLVVAAAVIGGSAFAYTWTGGANDGGRWTTPANWGVTSGYPQTASDPAIFNGDATVSLNTGSATTIAYLKVSAGTVTISGTEGSSLNCTKAVAVGGSGLVVSKGATLILSVPLPLTTRFDKWEAGTLILRDATVSRTDTNPWYVAQGTNILDGTTTVSFPNSPLTFGNSNAAGYMPVFIRDSAKISVKTLMTTASTAGAISVEFIQEGADTEVTVSGTEDALKLVSRTNDVQRYTLKSGTLTATKFAAVASPPVGWTYHKSPTNLVYVQEGGTSTFDTVAWACGSAALRGGVMNFTGTNDKFTMGNGTAFDISGGTLAWPRSFNPAGWPRFRWSGKFGVTVPSGESFEWDWSKVDVAPGTVFVHDGAGTLTFARGKSTEGVGLEIAAGKTVTLDSSATLTGPRGSYDPWKLTIQDGATFKLSGTSSRLSVPLDLTVNGTGKILFNNFRGAAVAHRLTVDGVEKGKGIYRNSTESFVSGTANCVCLMVPHIWTGAGDGVSWSDPANWDSNTVPNGNDVAADISRATGITLGSAISLGGLIAMPNGATRKVTVSGSGKISLYTPTSYACGIIVPEECELELNVDLERTSNNTMGMAGGGKLTLTKDIPSTTTSANPLLAINGTLALKGVKTLVPYTGSTYNFLTYWTYEGVTSELLIEDGTEISTGRFSMSNGGYGPLSRVRQVGGSLTWEACLIQVFNGNTGYENCYHLENGTLTINNTMNLGRAALTSKTPRHPGGSFEMSGGTLTVTGIAGGCNQNYVTLYGGDVYLKGDLSASVDAPDAIEVLRQNDCTYYLGGVTIHPTGAARKLASGNAYLTGKNGDCTIDVTERNFSFDSGNTVSGPGGLTVKGVSGHQVGVSCAFTFTGPITVKSGEIICYYASSINGPRAVIVESADGKATFGRGIVNELDRIDIVQDANLAVSANECVTTKRLTINGVDLPAGTYNGRFGAGTVVVTGSASDPWLAGTEGDLSWMADGTTTTVDTATTLSSLTYYPTTSGETNTLTGAGALTFADGANIHVEEGCALVIDNDVTLGGKVTKTGGGEVVFNGAVSGLATPTDTSDETDPRWLTVQEGGATFDDAVTGVRIVSCGVGRPPVVTLNEHCTVTNYAIVLTAYSDGLSVTNATGETHQNGATVDYSDGVFRAVRLATHSNGSGYSFSNPNGGSGRWVLNAGTFKSKSGLNLSFMANTGEVGAFEFMQNGGTNLVMGTLTFARGLDRRTRQTYTLNGGRVEFTGAVEGTYREMNIFNFNGGVVAFSGSSGRNFAAREYFTVRVSGDTAFEMMNAANTIYFPNDWTGEGKATFFGGNFVFTGGLNIGGVDIAAGMVTLGPNTALAAAGATELSVARGASLCLDYEGQMPFKTLKVADRNRAAGMYSVAQGPNSVRNVLEGDGELLILEGSVPGIIISIR